MQQCVLCSCSTHWRSCTAPAFTHLKNCQLCATLNFLLPSFAPSRLAGNKRVSWPAAGAHLQPLMHSYPRKLELVLIVNYSCCYLSATLTGRYSHTYPTFHPPSYYMGSSASRVQWCGRTLELQKLLGLKQRPKFPPTFCCPQPPPCRSFLFSVHKQEQVCALLSHGQCRHRPPHSNIGW